MKIETIRAVKAKLNQVVADLPETGSVVITRNGKPCAVLLPVTEETDLEALLLSHNKRFWELFDRSVKSGEHRGWTRLEDLSD
ncbi:MAG: type II toxin-antitoxin system Phd/YefM family antitoxin [Deltaproteobacteria bacterium]|nr:type II toxin-antitoxin system Phd/YefM family antitoxin [Deltaproteobacteria bacterium]